MSGKLSILFLLVTAFVAANHAANILCVFTSNSLSHLIYHMSYARALLKRGHNITLVTTLRIKDRDPKLHHIYIPPSETRIQEMAEMKSQMAKPMSAMNTMRTALKGVMAFGPIQYDAIKDKRFQDFMHNPDNKFDALIMGYFFSDYQLGLGVHFKCPVIVSWMSSSNLFVDRFVGNPPEIAYVSAAPLLAIPDPLTFNGRLSNFLISITSKILSTVVDWQMRGFYNDLFPSSYPSLKEAGKKVSLLLCNSHFSEGIVRPNVPAVIEVGGIQIKEKPDPLPMDLQEIFNASSEHGVIYLSFGSNLGSDDLSKETFKIIYEALVGLKQTILWKWDGVETPGDAPNIHYKQWLPQDDLLAQPNLRLFITHAGKGSVVESQYHGVPMVAIPFIADQPGNAGQLAKDGFGVIVNRNTITTDTFRAAILEVLENPKYKESIKRFSMLYRDRPMSARDTAVYWIEYVIRYKGAYHMQSPLVHLNILQYVCADVIAFLLVVAYVTYKLITVPAKYVLRQLSTRRSSKKEKVKEH